MIELTRLHGQKITINADIIEFVEATPDTMITTTTGKKVMVQETIRQVTQKVIDYKRRCHLPLRKRMWPKGAISPSG